MDQAAPRKQNRLAKGPIPCNQKAEKSNHESRMVSNIVARSQPRLAATSNRVNRVVIRTRESTAVSNSLMAVAGRPADLSQKFPKTLSASKLNSAFVIKLDGIW